MQTNTQAALEQIIRMAETGEYGIADVAGKALAGMDWQSIESAPKDGSCILLGRAEDEANDRGAISTPGRWHDEDHDGPDNMGHDAGFMDDEFQQFAWARSCGVSVYASTGFQPTHWQPLPAAPGATPAHNPAAADWAAPDLLGALTNLVGELTAHAGSTDFGGIAVHPEHAPEVWQALEAAQKAIAAADPFAGISADFNAPCMLTGREPEQDGAL